MLLNVDASSYKKRQGQVSSQKSLTVSNLT